MGGLTIEKLREAQRILLANPVPDGVVLLPTDDDEAMLEVFFGDGEGE